MLMKTMLVAASMIAQQLPPMDDPHPQVAALLWAQENEICMDWNQQCWEAYQFEKDVIIPAEYAMCTTFRPVWVCRAERDEALAEAMARYLRCEWGIPDGQEAWATALRPGGARQRPVAAGAAR